MAVLRTQVKKERNVGIRSSRRAIARTLKTSRVRSRFSRRTFLRHTAGAGVLMSVAPQSVLGQKGNGERRTLFFNMSRPQGLALDAAGKPATYFMTVGGRIYPLRPLSGNPGVLARERKGNAFLRAVPEQKITHFLEDLVLSTDITPLAYTWTLLNQQAGTWKMESIVQLLSPSSMSQAWSTTMSDLSHGDPVPLSAKREFYGMPAIFSKQEMVEELALVDFTDEARTLIALHPDMLCANPAGACEIAAKYVSTNRTTTALADLLEELGPASPQASPQRPNGQGWATLIPINQDDGSPFKMDNGLNQYFPDWNRDVDSLVRTALTAVIPRVKNDTDLGADITDLPLNSNAHLTAAIEEKLTGKVWYRHDGLTAVDHGSDAFLNSSLPAWDFRQRNGETGLKVARLTEENVVRRPDGRVQIKFDNVANWFYRFLGVYFQFVDQNENVILREELPPDVLPNVDPSLRSTLDRGNALYAGIIPPVYSLAGIPCWPPGNLSAVVNLPAGAAGVNVFLGGLGLSGSQYDPTHLRDVGKVLTLAVNFGMVAFFMAVGESSLSESVKDIASFADVVAAQLVNGVVSRLNSDTLDVSVALTLFQYFLNSNIGKLVEIILTKIALAIFKIAIPIAGQIIRAASLAIGTLTLGAAIIEARISPPIYQFDLSFTHDLSLNILPDPNSRTFPPVTNNEVLYYKINYLFNNGSPHFVDHVDVPNPNNITRIPVTLKGIPWGGKVNISVGFYIRKKSTNPSENDMSAAHGTTGLIPNTDQPPPDIVLQNFKIPIVPGTVYIHTSKTILDGQGKHRWMNTPAAPLFFAPSSGQEPGDIAAFRSITVRQATQKMKGYVGYSWQSFSRDIKSCQTFAVGQLDMAANLNTDQGGDGANAQDGYTVTTCGLQGSATAGLSLSYNLLTDPNANFYLDTSSLMLRQIALDPTPDFSNPTSGKSFGKLNLASTMLRLHPAGHVVSINNANSIMEALHLPVDPLDDSIAAQRFLARTYSGPGSRPGLMRSPVAACVTAEGAILVLEDGTINNRIQAFDLGGNPLPYFTGQKDPYFLYLTATEGSVYLDLAVEFSGYIYVLSRKESLSGFSFRLDIYHPSQSKSQPICTTTGMNAARLTVDFWRSVYTLNYERLKLPSGAYPGITEPSVSFWLPRSG